MEPFPKLTCGRCKRRKIRCDKRNPCSACERAGIACEVVQRARLPRGRSANVRESMLGKRLARLESLVTQAQNSGNGWPTPTHSVDAMQVQSSTQLNPRTGKFVAPEFWTALIEEIADLRETLEDSDDEQDPSEPPTPRNAGGSLIGGALLFRSAPSCIHGCTAATWPKMSKEIRNALQRLYRQRVDSLYKILHWPSVLADLECLQSKAQGARKTASIRALELSIYFMALCSITDDETSQLGLGHRVGLIEEYREASERAISEVDLFQQPNVIALQAFVIYLLGLRTCNNSAKSWTLLAVAIRIGSALRLGQEDERRFDPFELEIRRRLWYSIALMDTFASLDRGTDAMLRWDSLGPAPLVLNDDEMSPGSVPKSPSPGFKDMSFFALMFRAMACHKKVLSMPDNTEAGWTTKVQLVSTFEQAIKQDYVNVKEDAEPLEKFTAQAATSLIAATHLILRRPPYKQRSKVVPPSDDFDVLEQSTKVLQHELEIKSSEFAPWAWKSWVQWHALAIVLAELSSQPPGATYDAAYAVAVRSFDHYSSVIADNSTGMLWKPIAKLMCRVQRQRENRATTLTTPDTAPLTMKDSSCGSGQSLNMTSMLDPDEWANFDTLNPWAPNLGGALDADVENVSVSRGDQTMAICGDSQSNWSMFMEEIYSDYSLDLKDDTSWNMST